MIDSILEKALQLRLLAIDITNCEYYGEDDAVLGNLVPADIVNALDNLTESLRKELAEIEKQEPLIWVWQHSNGKIASDVFNTRRDAFDAWNNFSSGGSPIALYASPVQQSPAVPYPTTGSYENELAGKFMVDQPDSASTDSGVKI